MGEIGVLAAILGALALGAVASWVVAREQRARKARAEGCAARGWRYAPGKGSARFTVEGSTNGIPWTLCVRRSKSGSSSSSHATTTIWEAPADPTGAVVLLGPKLPQAFAGIDLGGAWIQLVLRFLLGDDATDLADLQQVEVGSAELQAEFSVLASTEEDARSVIVPEVDAAVRAAAEPLGALPVVLRWRDRVQVRIHAGAWEIERIEALVALGVEVAERCGYEDRR